MDDLHDRPHCRVEIETFPSRVFVRLHFANGNGDLRAGVLTLEPKIWLALLSSLKGWCEVEVEGARDTMVWQPSVVADLLTDDVDEDGSGQVAPADPAGSGPGEAAGSTGLDPVSAAPGPEPVEPADDDDIIAVDVPDDDPFNFNDDNNNDNDNQGDNEDETTN